VRPMQSINSSTRWLNRTCCFKQRISFQSGTEDLPCFGFCGAPEERDEAPEAAGPCSGEREEKKKKTCHKETLCVPPKGGCVTASPRPDREVACKRRC
jgi:hypothetical protein